MGIYIAKGDLGTLLRGDLGTSSKSPLWLGYILLATLPVKNKGNPRPKINALKA